MTIENHNVFDQVRIVGNSVEVSPDPIGCTGGLVGYTPDGRPIVDYFNPKDGNLHMAAFNKEDVEGA